MPVSYASYREDMVKDIIDCIEELQCQPILFIGSGVSLRYFKAPNWYGLLEELVARCPNIDKPFVYFKQKFATPAAIGQELATHYFDWAWGDGRESFPDTLFVDSVHSHAFIKHEAARIIAECTPATFDAGMSDEHKRELQFLRAIAPHAIITTNYDTFLEAVFPDYAPIIGETIFRSNYSSVGELLKVHGCVSNASTVVLTQDDYSDFAKKRKYLSAKLLTYFLEHPLVFIGYSATDKNITQILADIDVILAANGEIIPNIYLVEWNPSVPDDEYPTREFVVDVGDGHSVRIKRIVTSSFQWVFEAFATQAPIHKVNVKLLRALVARTCQIVRHDIPRHTIQVDWQTLEHTLEASENLAHVLGIQTVANSSMINADFPFTLTEVAKKIGGKHWNMAQKLLDKIEKDKKFNIKNNDNSYHVAIKVGKAVMHKYSELLVDLLRKVKKGDPYDLSIV